MYLQDKEVRATEEEWENKQNYFGEGSKSFLKFKQTCFKTAHSHGGGLSLGHREGKNDENIFNRINFNRKRFSV